MRTLSVGDLTPLQQSVLRFYVDTIGEAAGDVTFYRSGVSGTLGERTFKRHEFVVVEIPIAMTAGPSLHFYGTLGDSFLELPEGQDHEHQFTCTFDEASPELVALVTDARVHHLLAAPLVFDATFLLDEEHALRERGYSNVLATSADLHVPFQGRTQAELMGTPNMFFALLPLTPIEWRTKLDGGVSALFRQFEAQGRDLLALAPRAPKPS